MTETGPICPECQQGKHPNCDGTAWNNQADDLDRCHCPHTTHQEHPMTDNQQQTGAQAIAAERQRQIDEEGYTAEHDEHHAVRQFVATAVAYLGGDTRLIGQPWPIKRAVVDSNEGAVRYQRRDLVKAGALIAAAIDRLDQIEAQR